MPPPGADSYADDGAASSRHNAINAAKIAGPRKRPTNPKALSPPKIPSKTQMNESRAELPIRSGRTKFSAKKTIERSAEGYSGKESRQSPKQQRMRQSANGIGNSKTKALAKCHKQVTIHRLTHHGYHACSEPSSSTSEQPITDHCKLFDKFVTFAINEEQ